MILMNYELLEDRDYITFVLHFNAWSCACNRVGLHKCWLEGWLNDHNFVLCFLLFWPPLRIMLWLIKFSRYGLSICRVRQGIGKFLIETIYFKIYLKKYLNNHIDNNNKTICWLLCHCHYAVNFVLKIMNSHSRLIAALQDSCYVSVALVSSGYCIKWPQTRWLETVELVKVLEVWSPKVSATGLNASVRRASEALRGNPFLASSSFWRLLAFLDLWLPHSKLCLCGHSASFSSMSNLPWLPSSKVICACMWGPPGSSPRLKTLNLIISAETLPQNVKIIAPGIRTPVSLCAGNIFQPTKAHFTDLGTKGLSSLAQVHTGIKQSSLDLNLHLFDLRACPFPSSSISK